MSKEKEIEILTLPELCALIKVKQKTAYTWVENREIPHLRAGKKILFDKAEILGWLRQNAKRD